MRKIIGTVVTLMIVTAFAAGAQADFLLESFFGGTVTQAPAGNIFAVDVGDAVSGDLITPNGDAVNNDNNFQIGFKIGLGNYVLEAPALGGPATVAFSNGLISAIDVAFPPTPCIPGSTTLCPAMDLSGALFNTVLSDLFNPVSSGCQAGEVCGSLDFTSSALRPIPEPSTLVLLATCLLAWLLFAPASRRRLAGDVPVGRTGTVLSPCQTGGGVQELVAVHDVLKGQASVRE